ncbi:GNAT family N-acetyltransferase [Acetanaerobacterium elongatum]|uniref:Acetyltransferase (GNAT) domain-containing protein n=1 Tax=Acetanaerobacterium elongatum TaxID=258515 RepID=A0A1G9UQQ5_9FIRM|nr:GNAT family N-acetyltransferase [Acetanaerobacterium elongatum]SDM62210.1 Acetyltransferase (GNAT) domain-containing protein [Acetanaerobacterium elongatum]
MELIKDYRLNDTLRLSLGALAKETFSLGLEEWYQAGFWNESYIPYSLVEDGTVLANVSANTVSMIFDGKPMTAVLIGTVMTDKAHRGKGYSARLMNAVLEEYRKKVDMIYLFANTSVLSFYPRFGFVPREEWQCFIQLTDIAPKPEPFYILDIHRPDDLALVQRLITSGKPADKRLRVTSNSSLILYYCINGLNGALRYYPNSDTLVFIEDGLLLDYYSGSGLSLQGAAALLNEGQGELPLGFTPSDQTLPLRWQPYDDHLFVLGGEALTGRFMFHSLSRA